MEADEGPVAVGAQAVYDAVASAYDRQFGDELHHKPLDRALLGCIAEVSGAGRLADVGCGPGQVTRFLAERHPDVIGIDVSPRMIAVARQRASELAFTVGSMLALPADDNAWSGIVALYSIIHLTARERATAFREFARVIRPGGRLLMSFHVDSADFSAGQINRLTSWFGHRVQLDGYFLDPDEVTAAVRSAGFFVEAQVERQPASAEEYPSRRCYLLARRR